MSVRLKKGDVFESRRHADEWAGGERFLTVVQVTVRGKPGFVLCDSEARCTVWRVYVKRTSLLDPKRYTRREAKP